MALSCLWHAYGAELPELPALAGVAEGDRRLLLQMLERGVNAPLTSSCGRLFDGVAALCGLRLRSSYEGQAALELEMAIEEDAAEAGAYPYDVEQTGRRRRG
jgi:hydrogenase maturation protein HypF